jgi:hypothetical protein
MRRYRLSTLLFLIAIVALVCALVVQTRRAAVREETLRAELERMRITIKLRETMRQLERAASNARQLQAAHSDQSASLSADTESAPASTTDQP